MLLRGSVVVSLPCLAANNYFPSLFSLSLPPARQAGIMGHKGRGRGKGDRRRRRRRMETGGKKFLQPEAKEEEEEEEKA